MDSNAPVGQQGTRGALLTELKRAGPLTAKSLGLRLGMSLNAVRHHLKALEARRLIEYERTYRGVGAPAFTYRLTSAGEALFPRRYEETLSDVLNYVVAREGRGAAVEVLEARFRQMAHRLRDELADASVEERTEAVSRVLAEEGYMPEWQARTDGEQALIEHNCPIRTVAERFPEICAAEARFLAEVLETEVTRTAHMVNGCTNCEYHVRPGSRELA